METLISLVIFGVIYSLVYVVKHKLPKIQGDEPDEVMDEPFQQTYMPEPETIAPAVTKKKDAGNRKRPLLNGEGKAAGNKEHRSTYDSSVENELPKGKRFSIANRSEAKRAFIYSEIFNRKYQ